MDEFRNIAASVSLREALVPAAVAAGTAQGAAIDRFALNNPLSAVLRLSTGAATGAPSARTVDAKLQHSADGSTGWADLPGAAAPQVTADNGATQVAVNLLGARRFLRVERAVAFTGGTSPTVPVAVTLAFGGAERLPAP